jgi:hypothetical protein
MLEPKPEVGRQGEKDGVCCYESGSRACDPLTGRVTITRCCVRRIDAVELELVAVTTPTT